MSKAARGVDKTLTLFEKTKEAAKKGGRAVSETAKGAAIRAGSLGSGTKVVKGTTTRNLGKGFGLRQTGPGKGTRAATKAQRSKVARSGAKRIGGAGAAVGAGVGLTRGEKKQTETKKDQPKTKKFNVGVSKGGVPFNQAFKHYRDKGQKQFTWNGKKYTTELDTEKAKRLAPKKKKVGGLRKFLLGEDGKFGGKRGAIDFLPGKSRPGRQGSSPTSPASAKGRKIVSKANGGMMKAKGMAKGGKMMKKGYAMGGAAKKFPDMTGDGKVTQKDILKARGVPGFSKGAMVGVLQELMTKGARAAEKKYGKGAVSKAKKELNRISGLTPKKTPKTEKQKKLAAADQRADYLKMTDPTPAAKKQRQVKQTERRIEKMEAGKFMGGGSVKKKGYAKGGMAKKGYSKGGVARKGKPRGVGAAMRGYGKALR